MPKAVISDLINLGFRQEQFGDPVNWSASGGYLDTVLADAALEVQGIVGASIYATPTSLQDKRLRRAEIYFAAAELWRRIEQFERSNAHVGREATPEKTESRALTNADRYDDLARAEVKGVAGTDMQSGIAVGYVETGHYAGLAL